MYCNDSNMRHDHAQQQPLFGDPRRLSHSHSTTPSSSWTPTVLALTRSLPVTNDGAMSYLNLSDRLKAAVNSIDAAGNHLQQRALGQNASQQPSQPTQARATPTSAQPATPPTADSSTEKNDTTNPAGTSPASARDPSLATSPTKSGHPYSAANALAEGALSNLRKSFNFSRQSLDSARPGPSSPRSPSASAHGPSSPIQELKDIPTSPKLASSRPSSPARYLSTTNQFSLGSDPSTAIGTPRPKSPLLRAKSPLHNPPPDPDDPATYPLPPSPTASSSPLPVPESQFADPLGASPLLPPVEEVAVPALEVEVPTPKNEEEPKAIEPKVEKVEVSPDREIIEEKKEQTLDEPSRRSIDESRKSGESSRAAAASTDDPAAQLAKAERRYEGE